MPFPLFLGLDPDLHGSNDGRGIFHIYVVSELQVGAGRALTAWRARRFLLDKDKFPQPNSRLEKQSVLAPAAVVTKDRSASMARDFSAACGASSTE